MSGLVAIGAGILMIWWSSWLPLTMERIRQRATRPEVLDPTMERPLMRWSLPLLRGLGVLSILLGVVILAVG